MICGTLLAAGMRINAEKLLATEGPASPAVEKHARAGELFAGRRAGDPAEACGWLGDTLDEWTRELGLPRLGAFGLTPALAEELAAKTPLRNNPVALSAPEILQILLSRL